MTRHRGLMVTRWRGGIGLRERIHNLPCKATYPLLDSAPPCGNTRVMAHTPAARRIMLVSSFLAQASASLIAPGLLFILAVAAAVGMILLLPARRETPLRAMGAVVLFASGIILAVQ